MPLGSAAAENGLPEAIRREDDDRRALAQDAELRRITHLEARVDRELALGLARFWDEKRYLAVGYSRPAHFVREILGIKASRAHWLAKLGRGIRAVPEIDRAHSEGRVGSAQVVVLSGIVDVKTPADERVAWIERASRMTVRQLAKEVQAEKQRRAAEVGKAAEDAIVDEAAVDAAVVEASGGEVAPAGGWMSIRATARAALVWQEGIELARMASGRHLTQGECAEAFFAEYLSAHPEAAADDKAVSKTIDPLVAEVIAALERQYPAPDRAQPVPGTVPPVVPPPKPQPFDDDGLQLPKDCVIDETQDAEEMAKTLKRLTTFKKRLRYDLAAGLTRIHENGDWYHLAKTFEKYCITRLGFGIRRAERLIRFHAGIEKFPLLGKAHLEGGISYMAALQLIPILHSSTESDWVKWSTGITYRELERVAEYAQMYALPEANPSVLAAWVKGLAEHGQVIGPVSEVIRTAQVDGREASAFVSGESGATEASAFAWARPPVPPGYALPPAREGDFPAISGIPPELVFTEPEREVARIRFWLPQDAFVLAQRALDHARRNSNDPLRPTWFYLELIVAHFIRTVDNPMARAANRGRPIVRRDRFRCIIPGCMCRCHLESNHMKPRGECGPDTVWNQGATCGCHHRQGVHLGTIIVGGWAPEWMIAKLGIHPRTGRAFICYINEREVSEEVANRELAKWRTWLREREAALWSGRPVPPRPVMDRREPAKESNPEELAFGMVG